MLATAGLAATSPVTTASPAVVVTIHLLCPRRRRTAAGHATTPDPSPPLPSSLLPSSLLPRAPLRGFAVRERVCRVGCRVSAAWGCAARACPPVPRGAVPGVICHSDTGALGVPNCLQKGL